MLRSGLNEDAGRSAYLAGFHAAQAVLFEKEGKVTKTHKGVQSEFGRLVNSDPRFEPELRPFLGQTYSLKNIADYEIGPTAKVDAAEAAAAVAAAKVFVARLAELLAGSAPSE